MSFVNYIEQINAFEDGDLDYDETCELFQFLVDSGIAWNLQGSYGRTAISMLEAGDIQPASGAHVN